MATRPKSRTDNLRIQMEAVSDLSGYAKNSRTHTPEQIALIAASIREFGWTNPLIIDSKHELICGHARLAAAVSLGLSEVPAIQLGHLTPAQKRALVIADNRIAETGSGWNKTLLTAELAELKVSDFDLAVTGFSEAELDQMFSPAVDPTSEWQGMPEFDQQDRMAFRTVKVHFRDAAAVADFARVIGQSITDQTKWTWYPIEERADNTSVRYVSES